ncbi:adenylate/guanylate cyclase domain-containing protein [Bradyrhizobium sp. CB82]|uniref:adenylate/guanylate cyclase domain-containing protein n=1 Tax=Bradyrhizobium sp. CB82 TaxID=3039159 RepID=UPI0024B0EC38|nr:adenylate/guanylate cyclase domain-containing protein [Bradyrhizobium sp. CB82]WFU43569.1 adenylate/guanylate cyclase domain-containing protein [Bradyrhizobium sp. CB82]
MDVGGWLRRLGLERYETAFRENRIDDTVLPRLTAEDLKELGVGFVGDRRKLLDAIALLRAEAAAPAPLSDAPLATDKADTAERRQVTVMFSDLVGSTALSARMDPEDLREVISAYQRCVADTVQLFGGFVAKFMGDGVLVYFGYPTAHEDDAERAVRAGLHAIAAVAGLKSSVPLQTRVGIATGLVVVGDLIGTGSAQEQAIVGETPNLAARLQGIAEPNTVVIAEATRRLLGNLFELRDLGAKELKGIAGPVGAFAALRASSIESRFEAMHPGGLTALVGREEELELLLRRWTKAKIGDGQVVLLSGEAGIGKSRLSAALMESIAPEPHTRLRYFCSPQHTDSAFYPIIGQLERAAGFAHGDPLQTKLDKLDALLAQTSTAKQDTALVAEMLSLSNDGRYPALELALEQRREKTLAALGVQLEVLARASPVLMIVEDAHWADPTSLEAFGRIVDRIAALRVLLIVTFRPEFEAPWVGQPHVTALALNRLANREVGTMIDRVLGNKLLAADIRKDIIERTDGIPLFVEEMTKAVLEAGGELEAKQIAAAVPSPTVAVPASLHASLMARLDRLGPAKELAQIGAAIGREFSHALLAAVVRKSETELAASLDRLIRAGLLFRKGVPPHATYLFRHALVQDAAYGTLLREPRRALHARIADTFESQFAEIAEKQPEILARHCTEAGLIEKAAGLWGKAGQRSLARSALVEALEQLTRALAQIATIPATEILRREEIKLQIALITPLVHVKGYAAPETNAAAERARLLIDRAQMLGESPEDPLLLFSLLYGVWTSNYVASNGDAVGKLSAQFLTLAEKQQATAPRLIAHRIMGISLAFAGQITRSREHFDEGMALYDRREHRQLAARFSVDSAVSMLCYRSWDLWFLGYPRAALADADQAISDARQIGQATTLLYALWHASITQIECGNYGRARAQLDEAIALANETGAAFWKEMSAMARGRTLVFVGDASDAIQVVTSQIAAFRATGARILLPAHLISLARAHAELGQFEAAWGAVGEATAQMEAAEEGWWRAEVHRVAGEIALMPPQRDAAKAEAYFERSLEIAREQQARSWELRAAMSMARLWRDQGKRDEARELLAPVYGRFTEGFDTLDLKQAKALLDELA